MFDPLYALSKLGLRPGMSVSRAITSVGLDIDEASDPLLAANKVIVLLGAKPVSNTIMANIYAKALVEQAVVWGDAYVPENAYAIAHEKYKKIQITMPEIFVNSDENGNYTNRSNKASKPVNDKKTQALEIYNRETNNKLTNTAIAKIIAEELDITLANAQYYVTRVFAKYSK
jgi:hypothetical protein